MLTTGWEEGELLDEMLGVHWVECINPAAQTCACHPWLPARAGLHFYDAVGDLALVDAKWGPSVSGWQIRTLRYPAEYPYPDTLRVAEDLHDDPWAASAAARAIVGPNGEYRSKWTPYRTGSYLAHKGEDFELHSGHFRADQWDA